MILASDVPGQTLERDKRCIKAEVTYEALAKFLDMPMGYSIMCVVDDPMRGIISLKVKTTSTKNVGETLDLPELNPGAAGWGEI